MPVGTRGCGARRQRSPDLDSNQDMRCQRPPSLPLDDPAVRTSVTCTPHTRGGGALVDPKGLEPSHARVRAAASASRGSGSVWRRRPCGALSISFERRSISFVSAEFRLVFSSSIAIECAPLPGIADLRRAPLASPRAVPSRAPPPSSAPGGASAPASVGRANPGFASGRRLRPPPRAPRPPNARRPLLFLGGAEQRPSGTGGLVRGALPPPGPLLRCRSRLLSLDAIALIFRATIAMTALDAAHRLGRNRAPEGAGRALAHGEGRGGRRERHGGVLLGLGIVGHRTAGPAMGEL